jgi:LAO/AO transport system kinase
VKDLRQALHLRAGSALRDIPAHHGVDLGRVVTAERSEEAPPAEPTGWPVPVLATNALTEDGVDELLAAVATHRAWMSASGQLDQRRRDRAAVRIRDVVDRELRRTAWNSESARELLRAGVERITSGEGTPYSVARTILGALLR